MPEMEPEVERWALWEQQLHQEKLPEKPSGQLPLKPWGSQELQDPQKQMLLVDEIFVLEITEKKKKVKENKYKRGRGL